MTARAIQFIDTHSHLQVERLDGHRAQWLAQAREAGLENILLCAGAPEDWERTLSTAHEWGLGAMLGIHPLWLDSTTPAELVGLRELAESLLDDPHFIGLGEVGLDGFEPGLDQHKAEQVFLEELKIARDLDLPLSIHVRRTASKTLGLLRRVYGSPGKTGFQPVRGAVHAFNGSDAEREAFLAFGLVLGFGGACTYDGSKRIRRHLSELADGAWVLETDAPDMPPSSRRDAFALGHSTLDTRPADIPGSRPYGGSASRHNACRCSRECSGCCDCGVSKARDTFASARKLWAADRVIYGLITARFALYQMEHSSIPTNDRRPSRYTR